MKILIKIEKFLNKNNTRYVVGTSRDPMALLDIPKSDNVVILEYDSIEGNISVLRENKKLQKELTENVNSTSTEEGLHAFSSYNRNSYKQKLSFDFDKEFDDIGTRLMSFIRGGFNNANY